MTTAPSTPERPSRYTKWWHLVWACAWVVSGVAGIVYNGFDVGNALWLALGVTVFGGVVYERKRHLGHYLF
jgi:hypothetical protein